jgi:nucleoside-diphosphate-sugar epimerase
MVIGNGLLARGFARFASAGDIVIFASGVSNSREVDTAAFAREEQLLADAIERYPLSRLVYFSTCSVLDADRGATPYVLHKRSLEERLRSLPRSTVFRLPQVVGETRNPHTLTNYLAGRIRTGQSFDLWPDARRNLVDIDDVVKAAEHFMANDPPGTLRHLSNSVTVSVLDVVQALEGIIGRRASYRIVDGGLPNPDYPSDLDDAVCANLGIDFGDDYLRRTLGKYYGH